MIVVFMVSFQVTKPGVTFVDAGGERFGPV